MHDRPELITLALRGANRAALQDAIDPVDSDGGHCHRGVSDATRN